MTVDAAATQAPLAPLFGCPALHLRRPQDAVYELEWLPRPPPHERARSKANTCERCVRVSYELFNRGGLYLIRRTDGSGGGRPTVHETPSVPQATAAAWWGALLGGTAR